VSVVVPAVTVEPVAAPRDPFDPPDLLPDAPIVEEPGAFVPTLAHAAVLAGGSLPAAPRACSAWVSRKPVRGAAACDAPDAGRAALDWALDDRVSEESLDGKLASIEGCKGLDPGFVRAVRTERAPVECRDVLATPVLENPPAGLRGPIFHALFGHAVAAKAARVAAAEGLPRRAELLSGIESATADLPSSYGRAVALAGVAAAWTKVSPLDAARVERASHAAVEAMAAEGIGDCLLVEPARGALSVAYGWLAEIDALVVPSGEPGPRGPRPPRPMIHGALAPMDGWDDHTRAFTLVERLAEDLPSNLAAQVLDDKELGSLEALRAFAARSSLPARARAAIRDASPPDESRAQIARARLRLGLRFWDRRQVDAALRLLAGVPTAERSDGTRLLLALAVVLHGGPPDWPGWTREPIRPDRFDLGPLDAIAASGTRDLRALAEYDAGMLRELEAGPVAGELAPLEAQLHRYETVVERGYSSSVGIIRDRAGALRVLLKQLRDPAAKGTYDPSAPVRLEGWPRVSNEYGGWSAEHGAIFTPVRPGTVDRELRRLAYRFEPCFVAAAAAHPKLGGGVALHFVIDRAGEVQNPSAKADEPDGGDLAACIAWVTGGIYFPQPSFGRWTVDVRFRVAGAPSTR
jgi:hypothetical protein